MDSKQRPKVYRRKDDRDTFVALETGYTCPFDGVHFRFLNPMTIRLTSETYIDVGYDRVCLKRPDFDKRYEPVSDAEVDEALSLNKINERILNGDESGV